MGTITTQAVVTRVSNLLNDTTNVRWTVPELLMWISDAQREICLYKPDACVKTLVLSLAEGTKQALPSDGVTLLDITRNMGISGSVPGRSVRLVTREILDAQIPHWHSSAPSAEVKHYTHDRQNQKVFYVYPPQPSSGRGSLEVSYAAIPGELTISNTITVDDTWQSTLINYTLYRAYSKEAEYTINPQLAAAYYQAFIMLLTGKTQAEVVGAPAAGGPPANPNVRSTA
jgi:hypothetical protein